MEEIILGGSDGALSISSERVEKDATERVRGRF